VNDANTQTTSSEAERTIQIQEEDEKHLSEKHEEIL